MPLIVERLNEAATPAQLGWRVGCYRRLHNWSQDELAERARVSRETIGRIEKGQTTNPRLEVVQRLSAAMVVPMSWLIG